MGWLCVTALCQLRGSISAQTSQQPAAIPNEDACSSPSCSGVHSRKSLRPMAVGYSGRCTWCPLQLRKRKPLLKLTIPQNRRPSACLEFISALRESSFARISNPTHCQARFSFSQGATNHRRSSPCAFRRKSRLPWLETVTWHWI